MVGGCGRSGGYVSLTHAPAPAHPRPQVGWPPNVAGALLPGDAVNVVGGSAIQWVANDTSKPVGGGRGGRAGGKGGR